MSAAAIHPAERYEPCNDLWTLTCIFNPGGFASKLDNYRRFAQPFRAAGLPLLTIECAIGEAPFALPAAADVIHVRSGSALWQKERLLNIGLARLPAEATKVAWIDGDVLFSNPEWATATSALLDTRSVVQPFHRWHRLPRGSTRYEGEGQSGESFAFRNAAQPESAWNGEHGLPGLAWAARRDLLDRHGFYDACVIGGGDNMMAHAFNGSLDSIGVRRILGQLPARRERRAKRWYRAVRESVLRPPDGPFAAHYKRWAGAVRSDVDGAIGAASGHLLHLWHGDARHRRYHERHGDIHAIGYDPATDVYRNGDGVWEWHSERGDLRRYSEAYFRDRREDD